MFGALNFISFDVTLLWKYSFECDDIGDNGRKYYYYYWLYMFRSCFFFSTMMNADNLFQQAFCQFRIIIMLPLLHFLLLRQQYDILYHKDSVNISRFCKLDLFKWDHVQYTDECIGAILLSHIFDMNFADHFQQ